MRPIQERVYNAIERVANEKNYAFILDKSGSATLLFVNAKYDISDQILDLLGFKPSAKQEASGPSGGDAGSASDKPSRRKEVSNPEMRQPTRR